VEPIWEKKKLLAERQKSSKFERRFSKDRTWHVNLLTT